MREEILFIEDVDSKLEEEESAKEEEEEDEDGHWVELPTTGKQISLKKDLKSLIIDSDTFKRACSSSTLFK